MLGAEFNQHRLQDRNHHGGAGGVADPHGEEGRGQHETEKDKAGRTSHPEQDPQSNSSVKVGMLDPDGHHQASNEEHAGVLHVEKADLSGGHDVQGGEEDDREKGGDWDGQELSQPVAAHQDEDIETPGSLRPPEEGQGQQEDGQQEGQHELAAS